MPYHSAICRLQTGRELPCTSNRKEVTTLLTQWEEGGFSPCLATAQATRDCHNSANEKLLHFGPLVSLCRLFVYKSPSQLPFISIKQCSSPLLLWTCPIFTIACLSQIAIFCYSQMNPFAGKINGYFTFTVDTFTTTTSLGEFIICSCERLQRLVQPSAAAFIHCPDLPDARPRRPRGCASRVSTGTGTQ